ncbi:conserved exported protein of unknown function [Rhodovastum atsumiense]|uniref:DUF4412 domain-containing protein n=1 Tax=Rhodovastum atsumiense TaxID=504468 RepID=A0A5M6IY92_9PROT|nr:hypothetical protein [Rhodovastum atsumiense]KAA5612929.1 hypothetical protein F1189_07795 [Rhodovastum atsumiense]CAH2600986.1 conserved exported protein of unknown function [Rhodovastum atsumiense]
MPVCTRLVLILTCLASGCLVASRPARTEDGPPPRRLTRDVAVTYRSSVGGGLGDGEILTRACYAAATGRERFESGGVVRIVDPRAKRAWFFVVTPGDPAAGVVTMSRMGEEDGSLPDLALQPDLQVIRDGEDHVAGLPCSLWRIRDRNEPEEAARTVCVSVDGLVLRSRMTLDGDLHWQEAIRVEYGPLDPAQFEPPPGWPVQEEEKATPGR